MFLGRMTEMLGVLMGHALRDGCIVDSSSIDKQAARARSERVRDTRSSEPCYTLVKGLESSCLHAWFPPFFAGMCLNEMKIELKDLGLRLEGKIAYSNSSNAPSSSTLRPSLLSSLLASKR